MFRSNFFLKLFSISLVFTLIFSSFARSEQQSCSSVLGESSSINENKKQVIASNKKYLSPEFLSEVEKNYESRGRIVGDRYPDLQFVLRDPQQFYLDVKKRFELQKSITPEDPRLFNFPESAPTMQNIRKDLTQFKADLLKEVDQQAVSKKNQLKVSTLGRETESLQTLRKVIQYVDLLLKDLDKMIVSNHFPYRDTVHTLYYYSRIRGFYQFKELGTYNQVMKYLDQAMHGYRSLTIDSELQLYERKGSPIVQVRSGKMASEFRIAELAFKDAFENRETLEFIVVPSIYALGASAFMQVLPARIHILGATNTPVKADGFDRPGGLFWMHDVRHEADRYMKLGAYRKANGISSKQEQILSRMSFKWYDDFLKLKNSVADENLKGALEHYFFYTHHDVGIPMIPSMFLNHHMNGLKVYYAFLFHKKLAKQKIGYNKWLKTTREAQALLTQFWEQRRPYELEVLGREPVKIENWEEWFPKSHPGQTTAISILTKAIEDSSVVRIKTDVGGIEGTLAKVIYSSSNEPIYFNFSGKARLVDQNDAEIPNQGYKVHAQGYSSPIGPVKSISANNEPTNLAALSVGQQIEIVYESGINVRGTLSRVTLDMAGQVSVLTFSSAEVKLNEQKLYKPEWGSFDLLMGKEIKNIEFLL